MDLVQWIIGRKDGSFGTAFAPSWADRMPAPPSADAGGRALRRRSAPLVSRWLPHPIAVAELEGDPPPAQGQCPAQPGAVTISLVFAIDQDGAPQPLLPPGRGELALTILLSEVVSLTGDLLEALSLPLLSLAPDKEARGLDVALGSVGALSLDKLAELLCLLRAALDISVASRGLLLERARVKVGARAAIDLDGRLPARLAAAVDVRPEGAA